MVNMYTCDTHYKYIIMTPVLTLTYFDAFFVYTT